MIAQVAPDILVLTDFDYDLDGLALTAFAQMLAEMGLVYSDQFALLPNTGMPTGLDMDGNGYLGDARDAQGYGRFSGDGGMALLSKIPINQDAVIDLSQTLWRDVVGASLPIQDGGPFPSEDAQAAQRISTSVHWIVPFAPPNAAPFHLMMWSATPPVFDGPEDRNGLRNRDELRVWENVLDGIPPDAFILAGNANLDPADGDGLRGAMVDFLARPDVQDPRPTSTGGAQSADSNHSGDPSLDTADWPDNQPGNLRVSYVLPGMDWSVINAGVFWPAPNDPDAIILGDDGLAAGPHRLVWVDVRR